MEIPIIKLPTGKKAKVVRLEGGYTFKRKLRLFGIKEGKMIKNSTIQLFGGPVVIEVEGRQTTIGRGMAEKIFVEIKK